MKRQLFTAGRLLVVAVVCLTLTSQMPAAWLAWLTPLPRDLIQTCLNLVEIPLKRGSDLIRAPSDLTVSLGQQKRRDDNYLDLLALNRQLNQQIQAMQETIDQLSALRRRFVEEVQLLPVRVAGAAIEDDLHTLTLSMGAMHGIREGMVVATGASLVGRIGFAGQNSSNVRLITSPKTTLIVRILPPDARPQPRQALCQIESDPTSMALLGRGDADNPVQVGDLAHLADDRWPRQAQGLIVGTVVQVTPDPKTPLLRTQFVVKPLRSLPFLGQVIVINVSTQPDVLTTPGTKAIAP
ncbi:MAG: rod shape-determining protein MreC [Phycisphaeraceae bacterium]|nr:rod shape-determining protein MreC [Phycisphaeraceae bacterium]